jgi:hypothetical protein
LEPVEFVGGGALEISSVSALDRRPQIHRLRAASPRADFDNYSQQHLPFDLVVEDNVLACGIHGLSPTCMTRLVAEPDPTYIRSLFKTAAPTSRLRRTRAQEDETILGDGCSSHASSRFITWIRQD